ncbi:hypothetical protein CSOJ01_05710 [Colletotrichum sojae]|uniref:Uncharacterized protein n=1 Tax=Colletotrichum sojae TaxID=2175907 RepID=A0A8H6JEX6_9PEZI|nr:hypothetical protein CSOJ01_05710 [Colletotrichum sojae]
MGVIRSRPSARFTARHEGPTRASGTGLPKRRAESTMHGARRLTQAPSPSPQQPPSRNQLLRFALRKTRLPGSRKLLAPRMAAERFLLRYLERQCRAGVAWSKGDYPG